MMKTLRLAIDTGVKLIVGAMVGSVAAYMAIEVYEYACTGVMP